MPTVTEYASRNPALPLENRKHEEFAFRYAITANATQSYVDIYKCVRDAAKTNGSRLLADSGIRSRIDFIHSTQTDVAFASIIKNFSAKKTIVHAPDAVLTEVDDPQAQIAAATVMLKVGGKLQTGNMMGGNTVNNHLTVINQGQIIDLASVADKLMGISGMMDGRGHKGGIVDHISE